MFRLFSELFHLFDQLSEEGERRVDRLRRGHVHARQLEQGDRISAAAAGKEALIIRNGGGAFLQNAVCNGDGGGEAGVQLQDWKQSGYFFHMQLIMA